MNLYNIYIFTVIFSMLQFIIETIKTNFEKKILKREKHCYADEEFKKIYVANKNVFIKNNRYNNFYF